ncbi:MAG TPA: NYN domain-containing protein [Acidimicrobiales bacterium]|nr:NYN domain-containing protein [Acidimicrobiales bacterium]
MLGFSRLSTAAYGVIARVVDEDGIFRARVAEAADEDEVGRASWLWLHRPVGWLDDPAMTGDGAAPVAADRAPSARRDDKAAATRLRKAAADADAARRRTADQLAEVRRAEAAVRAERDALEARLEALQQERNAAVRRSKEVEAQLATARRDLKVARQATMDAEEELARVRSAGAPPVRPEVEAVAAPVVEPVTPLPAAPAVDQQAVSASVAAAATAAAELAGALADAAAALAPEPEAPAVPPVPPVAEPASKATAAAGGKGEKKSGKKGRKGSDRVAPALPPGVFDGTAEAHRALLGDAANLLVVDGYNVARAAWSGLDPEEERRRTVALLDDVQSRSGGRVVVVFDGDDAVTAPKASKNVRVRFSATGQTADDAIVDLLAATPNRTPVVVVSSDRAVAADARRQGAVAVGSRAFLTAAGR